MNNRSQQKLSLDLYLQQKNVQERIQKDIQRVRSDATVSIGNAASLFGFTENQLRDWEGRKLIEPYRKDKIAGRTGQRHRQYSMRELEKLAVIRELLTHDYTPGDILSNITEFLQAISSLESLRSAEEVTLEPDETELLKIDLHVEKVYVELFWRYYISQVLRLALMLICEDQPYSLGGLLLPLYRKGPEVSSVKAEEIGDLGESLIGWLGRSGSFYAFVAPKPGFEVPSDYQVVSLNSLLGNDQDLTGLEEDQTFVLLERRLNPFTISRATAITIHRLLAPIYESVESWRGSFKPGYRDQTFPSNEFGARLRPPDELLNQLTELVARLGGTMPDGSGRWSFCCLLLPHDSSLPIRLQKLIIQAQSLCSPYRMWIMNTAPHDALLSLSSRAFLSGRIVYRDELSRSNSMVTHQVMEKPLRSAMAVPIGAESGEPLGIFYIASHHEAAFNEDDQRLVRMLGRIAEDLLLSYQVRHRVSSHLKRIIDNPAVVNGLFGDFFSEQDFVQDIDALLTRIMQAAPIEGQNGNDREVSFIAIDVDQHSRIARLYGNTLAQNLIRKIGLSIGSLMRTMFMQYEGCCLYYIYVDRFYLMLDGVSLDVAGENAALLRQNLAGSHKVNVSRIVTADATASDGVIVPNVKVRVGVTSYYYSKLAEILKRSESHNIADVQAQITASLKESLKKGTDEGGDVVISWDRDNKIFKRLEPRTTN